MMRNPITGRHNDFSPIFNGVILNKYQVTYYQCNCSNHLFLPDPFWLDEAYSSAIASTDTGLLQRTLETAEISRRVIEYLDLSSGSQCFLDYGCGPGLFVRRMRDIGYNFIGYDRYSKSIINSDHQYNSWCILKEQNYSFSLATLFEVFEHISNPLEVCQDLAAISPFILFSTHLVPSCDLGQLKQWWYLAPESGQHVSFYTKESLRYLANSIGYNLYTNGINYHLLSKEKLADNPLLMLNKISPRTLESLIQSNHDLAKRRLLKKTKHGDEKMNLENREKITIF